MDNYIVLLLSIFIMSFPYIRTIDPDNHQKYVYAVTKKSLTITCQMKTKNNSCKSVTWYKNGNSITSRNRTRYPQINDALEKINCHYFNTSNLTITKLTILRIKCDQNGVSYVCGAREYGTKWKNITYTLVVSEGDTSFGFYPSKRYCVEKKGMCKYCPKGTMPYLTDLSPITTTCSSAAFHPAFANVSRHVVQVIQRNKYENRSLILRPENEYRRLWNSATNATCVRQSKTISHSTSHTVTASEYLSRHVEFICKYKMKIHGHSVIEKVTSLRVCPVGYMQQTDLPNISVHMHDNFTITCEIPANPTLKIVSLIKSNKELINSEWFTNGTFTKKATRGDAGKYTCTLRNSIHEMNITQIVDIVDISYLKSDPVPKRQISPFLLMIAGVIGGLALIFVLIATLSPKNKGYKGKGSQRLPPSSQQKAEIYSSEDTASTEATHTEETELDYDDDLYMEPSDISDFDVELELNTKLNSMPFLPNAMEMKNKILAAAHGKPLPPPVVDKTSPAANNPPSAANKPPPFHTAQAPSTGKPKTIEEAPSEDYSEIYVKGPPPGKSGSQQKTKSPPTSPSKPKLIASKSADKKLNENQPTTSKSADAKGKDRRSSSQHSLNRKSHEVKSIPSKPSDPKANARADSDPKAHGPKSQENLKGVPRQNAPRRSTN